MVSIKLRKQQKRAPKAIVAAKKAKTKQSVTALGQALRALGGVGGSALGGYFGAPVLGASAGNGLGALVSQWLGQGDYSVTENSIVTAVAKGTDSIPSMHKTGQSIVVRHKEYISQIFSTNTFANQRALVLNPGDSNTFPWLSTLAARFEQYRIRGMVFHYIPTSGYAVSGTNPALGSVMMQTSYRATRDPVATQPTDKLEMMNEYWACEAAPCEAFCHPIECSPLENPFNVHYVRTTAVDAGDTPLMYDYGVTYVSTSGMPATNNVVGDLWVSYEIELLKPVIASTVSDPVANADLKLVTGLTGNNMFGTVLTTSANSLPVRAANQTITFPIGTRGRFVIFLDTAGTFVTPSFGAISYTNCTADTMNGLAVRGSGSTTSCVAAIAVTLTDPGVEANIFVGAMTGTITAVNSTTVIISQR